MKYINCLLIVILATIVGFGQGSLSEVKRQAYGDPFNEANQSYYRMWEMQEGSNSGPLFVYEDWSPATFYAEGDVELSVDSANYNLVDDKIYFIREEKLFEIYPEKTTLVVIGMDKYLSLHYKGKKKKEEIGYFCLLSDGNIKLLSKSKIVEKLVSSSPMGLSSGEKSEKLSKKAFYYFDYKKNVALELPKNKKKFLKIFGRDRSKMLEYVQKNDISTSNLDDLLMTFNFYNNVITKSKEYQDQ